MPSVVGLLWVIVLAVAAFLAFQRYRDATVFPADFGIFFRAGQAVAAGHSPYSVSGFVYPPFLAVVLAPFSHVGVLEVFRGWLVLSLACVGLAIVCVLWVEVRPCPRWLTPLLFGFFAVTAFHFWPLVIELPDGQSDTLVLAVLSLAYVAISRGRSVTSAVLVALAALIKGWPVLIGVVFLQSRLTRRVQSLVAFAVVLLVAPILAVVVDGAPGPRAMISAIAVARSQPRLASYSVWGIPRLTFATTRIGHPLVLSPLLTVISTVVLLGWVVGILVLGLRHAECDRGLTFWNVVFCVVLLLPISHLTYTMLALPVLWIWSVRATRSRQWVTVETVVFAVLLVWWLTVSQSALGLDTDQASATIVFFADLVACTTSIVGLALVDARSTVVDPLGSWSWSPPAPRSTEASGAEV